MIGFSQFCRRSAFPTLTLLAGASLAVIVTASCGKKKEDAVAPTTDPTAAPTQPSGDPVDDGDGGGGDALSELAMAYPVGLALSAFPTTLNLAALVEENQEDSALKPPTEKLAEAEARLNGEGECFDAHFFQQAAGPGPMPGCYAPDWDLLTPPQGVNQLGRADGEACMVAYTRAKIKESIRHVDKATGMAQALLCQAKKSGVATELPNAEGGEIDVTDAMNQGAAGKTGNATVVFEKAKIVRLADANDRPVFRTDIVLKNNNKTQEFHIVHSPGSSSDNASYNGQVWMRLNAEDINPATDNSGQPVLSLTYARSGTAEAPRLVVELRSAIWNLAEEPFTEAGVLDYNHGAVFTGQPNDPGYALWPGTNNSFNRVVGAQQYVAFDLNPLTTVGKLSFWVNPGGNYVESARGMVFEMNAESDGTLAGCSVSGSASGAGGGTSIRRALREGGQYTLEPKAYYHPQGTPQTEAKVYRQCFKQNATTGLYEIDDSKVTDATNGYDVVPVADAGVQLPDLSQMSTFETNIKE